MFFVEYASEYADDDADESVDKYTLTNTLKKEVIIP
jgi:hypothetical protein